MSLLLRRGLIGSSGGSSTFAFSAGNLNGSSQYFSTPSDSALNGSFMTFSMWAYLDSTTSTGYRVIAERWDGASQKNFAIQYNKTGSFLVEVSNNGTGSGGGIFSANINDAWAHLVLTYDGVDLKFYIDAVEEASTAYAGTLHASTLPLTIGARDGGSLHHKCRVALVNMKDVALSPTEITTLYNSGVPKCWDDIGSLQDDSVYAPDLGHWDGGTGSELVDNSTSALTTTNNGSIPYTGTGLTVECS